MMIVLQTVAGSDDPLVLLLSDFDLIMGYEEPCLRSHRRSLTTASE